MTRTGGRHRVRGVVAVAVLGLLAPLAACGGPDATDVARQFLAAWQRGDGTAAGRLTTASPAPVADALTTNRRGLDATTTRLTLGKVASAGDGAARAAFTARYRLGALGTDWTYRGSFALRQAGNGPWRVVWAPTVIHPRLGAGQRLIVTRGFDRRAPILAGDGGRLTFDDLVVVVGVLPSAVKRTRRTLGTLADATGLDAATVTKQVTAARRSKTAKDQFLPLITLRQDDYNRIRKRIRPLPGTRFRSEIRSLARTRGYARQLLGTTGPISAEQLKRLGSPYASADVVGLSGLQAAYERRLAGVPSGGVEIVDAKGANVRRVASFAGRDGQPVRTTLDDGVQQAAEKALDGVGKPAALVAVRASTGAVLAVANRPVDDSFDRALTGRYPPGSTFKIVTTTALLDRTKLTPRTSVPCPPTIGAGGRSFRNFEGEAAGSPDFREDFAISCNTAFIRLVRGEPKDVLADASRTYGFGADYALGLPAYSGQVPKARDTTELAADGIGQGRVLASPLTMALVAGAVRDGTWHPPSLVRTPAPAAGRKAAKPVKLKPADAAALRSLMRSVVTSGTGTGVDLSGAPVSGKTGTAEFGQADPPRTHAWFTGFRGDLAFAVLVEGGGVGGRVAVPVARTFLKAAPAVR